MTVPVSSGATTSLTATRLPSLTGLRWIAAFAVFGFHIHSDPMTSSPDAREVLRVLFRTGAVGVSFFFILSGLVLTWSARPGDSPRAFWRRRAARVMPNHVVTWVGVLAILAMTHKAVGAAPALSGLFLVQSWIPDPVFYFGGNTPAWSLACEAAFYAAFPLLLPLLRRVPARRLWALASALAMAIWCVPLLALPLPDPIAYWFVWVFPVTRALEFCLGMTVALMVREGRWRGPGLVVSGAVVLGAYFAVPLLAQRWQWVAGTAVPLALLLAAAARSDLRGSRTVFASPAFIWLGEISFAFYLVHQPVIRLGTGLIGKDQPAPVLAATFAGTLGVAVLAAWVLYRLVERPMERRLSRPSRPKTGPSHPDSQQPLPSRSPVT
ncbi:acyltransferase [Sphaerisporangium sp. NPDC088356]|uniref:acyltransferase family protein n=1 Tax=Sphaerisporangium sp. NPDC088356 TaxID=3154871 RepID=UPI00343CA9BC